MASQSRTVAARAGYFASAGDRLGGRVASGRRLVAGREGPVLEVPLRLRVFGDERGELGEGGFDVGVGHRVGVDAAADAPRQGRAEDAVAVDRDIAGRALVPAARDRLDGLSMTRLRGLSASRHDPTPRTIRVAAAGAAATPSPPTLRVAAAAAPRPVSMEYPGHGCGAAPTRSRRTVRVAAAAPPPRKGVATTPRTIRVAAETRTIPRGARACRP